MHLLIKELVAGDIDSSGLDIASTLVAQDSKGEIGID